MRIRYNVFLSLPEGDLGVIDNEMFPEISESAGFNYPDNHIASRPGFILEWQAMEPDRLTALAEQEKK